MNLKRLLSQHKGVLLVGAAFALIYMGNGTLGPYLTLYYAQKGLSVGQIGLITAIGPLAALIFQTAWGRLADRTNRKTVLMAALLLSGVCAMLYLLNVGFAGILTVALLFVIVNMSVMPMSDAMALTYCTGAGYHFAPIRMCGTIGYSIMPVLLGTLATQALAGIFPVYLIISLAGALLVMRFPIEACRERVF